MVRDRPYQMAAELARGKINQVRNQYADWQSAAGSTRPRTWMTLLHRATHVIRPSRSWAMPGPDADQRADEALALAVEAADVLVRNATRTRSTGCGTSARRSSIPRSAAASVRSPGRGLDDAVPARLQRRVRAADLAGRSSRLSRTTGGPTQTPRLPGRPTATYACSLGRSSTSAKPACRNTCASSLRTRSRSRA